MSNAELIALTPEDDARYAQPPLGAPGRYEYSEGSLNIGDHLRIELRKTAELEEKDSITLLRYSAIMLAEHVRRISNALVDRTKEGEN